MSDAGCVGGRTVSGTHDVVNPLIYAPYFGATTGPSLPIDEGVGYVDWPISKTKAQLSGYAGGVPEPLGISTCEGHLGLGEWRTLLTVVFALTLDAAAIE
jgi:hypothetical protein